VNVGNTGPEWYLVGDKGQCRTETHVVANAVAVNPGEALSLDPLHEFQCRFPPTGHRGEAYCRFSYHAVLLIVVITPHDSSTATYTRARRLSRRSNTPKDRETHAQRSD